MSELELSEQISEHDLDNASYHEVKELIVRLLQHMLQPASGDHRTKIKHIIVDVEEL